MATRILVSDKLDKKGVDLLQSTDGIDVDVKTGLSPEDQAGLIGEYDGLIVRSATKLKGPVLEAAAKLKLVIRAGIGVDNIDIPACTERGIVVENTPHGNANSAAEHAVALLMSAARKIPQATASMNAGKWEKSKFMGVELQGKTLGVIGTGNIGGKVCKKAMGLGMKVVAFDPFLTDERAKDLGVEKVDLDGLWPVADCITLHVPLNDDTRGIVGPDSLGKMKKGVIIVNASRGGTVDEAALCSALDEGQVGAAALDVFEEEPLPSGSPLIGRNDVVLTPHLGASTHDAQVNVAVDAAEQMIAFFNGGEKRNALN